MSRFNSIRELLNTLSRGSALITEMFGKRKSFSFCYEHAVDLMDGNEDTIKLLIAREVLRQNGPMLELDDRFLAFFEDILEVNEEISTAYIDENIRLVRDNIGYWMKADSDRERHRYLGNVKSILRKIGRTTARNVVDLRRNVENVFKTEPNFKIKLARLENHREKIADIQKLIEQTEALLSGGEALFFKTAADEDLKQICVQLQNNRTDARHDLIETRRQIIEYINQVKVQSRFLEKLRIVKYLRDQFEIKDRTDIRDVLSRNNALIFEPRPAYPLNLSLDMLQSDEVWPLIRKIRTRCKSGVRPTEQSAENLSISDLCEETETETHVDLAAVRDAFLREGGDLFTFVCGPRLQPDTLTLGERITLFCRLISMFEDDLEVSDAFGRTGDIEYALVTAHHAGWH
jgi:hypothetical protein